MTIETAKTRRWYEHRVRLVGPGASGARLPATVLRDLLDLLIDGSKGALRLRVEGRSTARGTPPGWLSKAADFDVLALEEGSTTVPLRTRPLGETVPGMFGQPNLPGLAEREESDLAHRSPLSVFEDSLDAATGGLEDTDRLDRPLLETIRGFQRIFDAGGTGIETLEIRSDEPDAIARPNAPLRIERDQLTVVEELIRKTAPPQKVRVAGVLNTIRHHDHGFTLRLDTGDQIRGIAPDLDPADLQARWGKTVVVVGTADFRPSGSIARITADRLLEASGGDEIWSRPPKPILQPLNLQSLARPQGPRSGIGAIYGGWPGEESDEEVRELLAEMS